MSDNKKSTQLSPQEAMLARAKEKMAIRDAESAKGETIIDHALSSVEIFPVLKDGYVTLINVWIGMQDLGEKEKKVRMSQYVEAAVLLLVALRNQKLTFAEELLLVTYCGVNFKDFARTHDIDVTLLPQPGEPDGDTTITEWSAWMREHFGEPPELEIKLSSLETRLYLRLPDIELVRIQTLSIFEYLDLLQSWSKDVRSKTTPRKIKSTENRLLVREQGARAFADELGEKVRILVQHRDDSEQFGVHLALLERHLEKWRMAAKAARGKKGAPKKPHTEFIELAVQYEDRTFEEVLDYLDDINYRCTFEVDRKNKVISCSPDDEDEPYEVTFEAAKRAFTRARTKN